MCAKVASVATVLLTFEVVVFRKEALGLAQTGDHEKLGYMEGEKSRVDSAGRRHELLFAAKVQMQEAKEKEMSR